MARLIDLAEEEEVDPHGESSGEVEDDDRSYPNVGALSAMLSCYPWVSLASIHDSITTSLSTLRLKDALPLLVIAALLTDR